MRKSWGSRLFEDLVIRDGQAASAAGRLIKVSGGGFGLLWNLDDSWSGEDILPAGDPVVRLSHSDVDELRELVGRPVTVMGQWRGGVLCIDSAVPFKRETASVLPATTAPSVTSETRMSETASTIEQDLFSSGTILWRFRRVIPGDREEFVVSAVDVPKARAALEPVYGPRLRIYQSPWTARDLAALDAVIGLIDPARENAVGKGVTSEGVVYRSLALTYLNGELAALLERFPAGMLLLDVQVRPLH